MANMTDELYLLLKRGPIWEHGKTQPMPPRLFHLELTGAFLRRIIKQLGGKSIRRVGK